MNNRIVNRPMNLRATPVMGPGRMVALIRLASTALLAWLGLGALSACAPPVLEGGAACIPDSCSGCCRDGRCEPGHRLTACGSDGDTCVRCGAGDLCEAGVCKEPSEGAEAGCSAASCAGCCLEGICRPGSSEAACGSDGQECRPCARGQVCDGGRCAARPGAGGTGAAGLGGGEPMTPPAATLRNSRLTRSPGSQRGADARPRPFRSGRGGGTVAAVRELGGSGRNPRRSSRECERYPEDTAIPARPLGGRRDVFPLACRAPLATKRCARRGSIGCQPRRKGRFEPRAGSARWHAPCS